MDSAIVVDQAQRNGAANPSAAGVDGQRASRPGRTYLGRTGQVQVDHPAGIVVVLIGVDRHGAGNENVVTEETEVRRCIGRLVILQRDVAAKRQIPIVVVVRVDRDAAHVSPAAVAERAQTHIARG